MLPLGEGMLVDDQGGVGGGGNERTPVPTAARTAIKTLPGNRDSDGNEMVT